MGDTEFGRIEIESKVHDLAEALDRVKNLQANHNDSVIETRNTKQARLELLARDLQSVFEDIPKSSCAQFNFCISNGEIPRLWIDITSFVSVDNDKRTYLFSKETRLGRTIIAKNDDRYEIGKQIANYVAERIVEREKAIEGDYLSNNHTRHTDVSNAFLRRFELPSILIKIICFLAGILSSFAFLYFWDLKG